MIVLGIETTCDETAAAVVTSDKKILASVLSSQIPIHHEYGGVVPEIAARAHLEKIETVITQTMEQSGHGYADLDGIAVTAGPGLIGGVHVGVMTAKAMAAVHDTPFLAVNHLVAHALTVRLTHTVDFPYLLLLVSGGHTQLLICQGIDHFQLLGSTLDDALGETFDKTARLLNLAYPGGPKIEVLARTGNSQRFKFPQPLVKNNTQHSRFDFSFSGLKTAVRQTVQSCGNRDATFDHDIAASFQYTIEQILTDRCRHALDYCRSHNLAITTLVIAGGVAANQAIKQALIKVAKDFSIEVIAPPINLCTDNAIMVAWAGIEKLQCRQVDTLDFEPRPRWPLHQLTLNNK